MEQEQKQFRVAVLASRLFVTGSPSTRLLFASLQLAQEGHA